MVTPRRPGQPLHWRREKDPAIAAHIRARADGSMANPSTFGHLGDVHMRVVNRTPVVRPCVSASGIDIVTAILAAHQPVASTTHSAAQIPDVNPAARAASQRGATISAAILVISHGS